MYLVFLSHFIFYNSLAPFRALLCCYANAKNHFKRQQNAIFESVKWKCKSEKRKKRQQSCECQATTIASRLYNHIQYLYPQCSTFVFHFCLFFFTIYKRTIDNCRLLTVLYKVFRLEEQFLKIKSNPQFPV